MASRINEIERQAAQWAVETDNENFAPEQQAALDAWLESDPRHFGAYINARAALGRVERLGAAAQVIRQRRGESVVSIAASKPLTRRIILTGSLAAGLAAILLAGVVWWGSSYGAVFETAVGQTRTAFLPDHSAITLNTDTRADVRYDAMGRNIMLQHGEALFDVAKNKFRPFVVSINNVKVRAVGTSFSVAAVSNQPLRVMVREGVVEIDTPDSSTPVRVFAGSRATFGSGGRLVMETLSARQISDGLVWRSGHIFFRHQTLAASAHEFARYSTRRIVIDDPVVAKQTVTGMFIATDPAGFADAVAMSLNLKIEKGRDEIRISRK